MKVRYDEGVANRIVPEPCAADREASGEASVGDGTGQPLSRERTSVPGADAVQRAEGKTVGCATASTVPIRRGRRPWHAWTLLVREPGDLTLDRLAAAAGPHREGEEP